MIYVISANDRFQNRGRNLSHILLFLSTFYIHQMHSFQQLPIRRPLYFLLSVVSVFAFIMSCQISLLFVSMQIVLSKLSCLPSLASDPNSLTQHEVARQSPSLSHTQTLPALRAVVPHLDSTPLNRQRSHLNRHPHVSHHHNASRRPPHDSVALRKSISSLLNKQSLFFTVFMNIRSYFLVLGHSDSLMDVKYHLTVSFTQFTIAFSRLSLSQNRLFSSLSLLSRHSQQLS